MEDGVARILPVGLLLSPGGKCPALAFGERALKSSSKNSGLSVVLRKGGSSVGEEAALLGIKVNK